MVITPVPRSQLNALPNGGDDITPPVIFQPGKAWGRSKNMSKQDKKFFIALAFAQTAVLSFLIVFSPFYWSNQAAELKKLRHMVQFSQLLEVQTTNMESELKVQKLKQGFEKKGIGVEETFDLKSK